MTAETAYNVIQALSPSEVAQLYSKLGIEKKPMDWQELIRAQLKAMTIYDANNTCLTVEECAAFLKVHPKTITNHIHSGKIKANFIGRIWRIPKMQFISELIER